MGYITETKDKRLDEIWIGLAMEPCTRARMRNCMGIRARMRNFMGTKALNCDESVNAS